MPKVQFGDGLTGLFGHLSCRLKQGCLPSIDENCVSPLSRRDALKVRAFSFQAYTGHVGMRQGSPVKLAKGGVEKWP